MGWGFPAYATSRVQPHGREGRGGAEDGEREGVGVGGDKHGVDGILWRVRLNCPLRCRPLRYLLDLPQVSSLEITSLSKVPGGYT